MEKVQTVAVLGLGTMGHGIAQAFAMAGFEVCAYDENLSCRNSLPERIQMNLERMAEAGIVSREAIIATLKRVVVHTSEVEAVQSAQFVTEAVHEDLFLKQDLFSRLENLVSPETILASNSSSFPITQTAIKMKHPERAILTHWFNPPHLIPVVEVVPGKKTTEQTTQMACELLEQIGKTPVRIHQEIPGFLVNRVQVAIFREIWDLLDRGVASAAEIDRAIQGSMGLRLAALGPLAILDFAGLDISSKVFQNLIPHLRSDTQIPAAVQSLIDEGHFGVKTGKGFFDYSPQDIAEKTARRDHLYLALIQLLQKSIGDVPKGESR